MYQEQKDSCFYNNRYLRGQVRLKAADALLMSKLFNLNCV